MLVERASLVSFSTAVFVSLTFFHLKKEWRKGNISLFWPSGDYMMAAAVIRFHWKIFKTSLIFSIFTKDFESPPYRICVTPGRQVFPVDNYWVTWTPFRSDQTPICVQKPLLPTTTAVPVCGNETAFRSIKAK